MKIEGLTYTEMRHLTERIGEQAERHSEKDMVAEFSIPTWALLNGLESLGYKVNFYIQIRFKIQTSFVGCDKRSNSFRFRHI